MTVAASTLPPGPKGHWLSGSLSEFHQDVLGFYMRCFRDYGSCVGFRLGQRRLVLVNEPELIEHVLVNHSKDFAKLTYVLQLLKPLLGNGLLNSDGEFWLRQRRLIQPAFSKQKIAGYSNCMVDFSQRMIAGWQEGDQIDVHREMVRLTLEIVAKVLFDADVGEDAAGVGEALQVVLYNFLNRWGSLLPLPAYLPTPGNLRFHRSVRRLDEIIFRFIKERRESKEERNDLLSILLHARDEDDGSQMTDQQLRDEAMTLFLAGHETTANGMAFLWLLLGQNPQVEEQLFQELHTVLGGKPPTVEDLAKLPFTEAVVNESLRLYPPAYVIGRVAKKDCELAGYRIRAGATVLSSQWVMHRHPNYWDDPETFDPNRWLDGRTEGLPKFAYFPFGGGPRLCVGNNFGLMEMKIILATIAQKFRVDIVPDQEIKLRAAVTVKPEFGIQAIVRKR